MNKRQILKILTIIVLGITQIGYANASDANMFVTKEGVPIVRGVVRRYLYDNKKAFSYYDWEYKPFPTIGVFGKYCLKKDLPLAKALIDTINPIPDNEVFKKDDKTADVMYSLLGFARSLCILYVNQFSTFDRIVYNNLNPHAQAISEPVVESMMHDFGAPRNVAEGYSILCAFDIYWDQAVKVMQAIAPEGGFSHEYSLEDALFILHMHTQAPSWFAKWKKGDKYHYEQLTYASCLAGAVAKIAEDNGRIHDFSFYKPEFRIRKFLGCRHEV